MTADNKASIHLDDPEMARHLADDLREIGLNYSVEESPLRPNLVKVDTDVEVQTYVEPRDPMEAPPIDPDLVKKVALKLGMKYNGLDSEG